MPTHHGLNEDIYALIKRTSTSTSRTWCVPDMDVAWKLAVTIAALRCREFLTLAQMRWRKTSRASTENRKEPGEGCALNGPRYASGVAGD